MNNDLPKIALLYQAQQPPLNNGILKPMKPGGYADSGADIAYTLKKANIRVATPVQDPDVKSDLDWVFPDTAEGIQQALYAGAECLWLNTVLYSGHPIESFKGTMVIGQHPLAVDTYDDKWHTNNLLRKNGLPIPRAQLISYKGFKQTKPAILPPLIAKPIRGRGSEGVVLVNDDQEYLKTLEDMFALDRFGTAVYIEEYLSGQEITVTVMPAGQYILDGKCCNKELPWSLPGVIRFNHVNGVAPYNGTVAVVHNSKVVSKEEEDSDDIRALYKQCEAAAELVNISAPIRIDCRANSNGEFFLFDLNMKPNMTGPCRPGRQDQNSLTAMAAEKIGWQFSDLVVNIAKQHWTI